MEWTTPPHHIPPRSQNAYPLNTLKINKIKPKIFSNAFQAFFRHSTGVPQAYLLDIYRHFQCLSIDVKDFFVLTTLKTLLARQIKSLIGFSFFCYPCICSAYPSAYLVVHQSAWISICSAGLPARCSACLATHLAMHLAIWLLGCISACLVACLSVWRSARLLVDSSGCTWQRVWSHFGLVNNLSTLLPILQAAHSVAYSSIYSARLLFQLFVGLFYYLQVIISSICLFYRLDINPSFYLLIQQSRFYLFI